MTQWLVGEEPYLNITKRMTRAERERMLEAAMKESVDADVMKALVQVKDRGAVRALMSVNAWESFSGTTRDQEAAIETKRTAVMQYLLPAWNQLLKRTLDSAFEKYPPFVCERLEEETQDEEGEKRWKTRSRALEAVYQEKLMRHRYEVLRKLLFESDKRGKSEYGDSAPDGDSQKDLEGRLSGIKPGSGKGDSPPKPPGERDPEEEMRNRLREGMAEFKRGKLEEDASRFGVSPEAMTQMRNLERENQGSIDTLAERLAEAFLSQRRAQREFQRAEGQLTPGMEAFIVAEGKRGNQDVRVYEHEIQATDFTSTDVEVLVDSSGSMQGERLKIGQALVLVIQKAFERVRALLEDEQLLRPEDEEPLRVGYAGFTSTAYRIKKLSEPLEDKSLAQMIHQTNTRSGGTDDASAIEALTTEFRLNSEATLKFVIIASDGEGSPAAVQAILDKIQKGEDMCVVVCGLGANASAVLDTYGSAAREAGQTNILLLTGSRIEDILPLLVKFLYENITKKTEVMSV